MEPSHIDPLAASFGWEALATLAFRQGHALLAAEHYAAGLRASARAGTRSRSFTRRPSADSSSSSSKPCTTADVRRLRRPLACAALIAAIAGPAPAVAAPPLAGTASVADRVKARRAMQEGEARLAKGDLEGALERFLYAATTVPSAQVFRQVAQLQDRLGRAREAVAAYEAALELGPGKDAAEVRARIAELRQTPGRVVVKGSPIDAALTVDGETAIEGLPIELALAPGEHRFVLAADGYAPHAFVVDVEFGSLTTPIIDLEREAPRAPTGILDELERPAPVLLPTAPPPVPLAPPPPSWAARHPATLTLSGLALGAAGVGLFFGLEAIAAQRAFADRPSAAEADRGERAAFRADIAFGAALLVGAAAVAVAAHEGGAPAPQASAAGSVHRARVGGAAGGEPL